MEGEQGASGLLLGGRAIEKRGMTDPDDLVRHEAENLDKETAQIKNPSTQEEWVPTGNTIAIIAIITALIAIISDFLSK